MGKCFNFQNFPGDIRRFKALNFLGTAVLFVFCAIMVSKARAQNPDSLDALGKVLIFHKQNGYIHTATEDVVNLIKGDLAANNLEIETTTDSLVFTEANLSQFGAIIFINTNYRNGPLLNSDQEKAFENYIRKGGGFVGIHSAVPLNGEFEESIWPWYASLFGARFKSHPPMRVAPFEVEDFNHPSTENLPQSFNLNDEWYAVQINPREDTSVHVLATVDETGFPAGSGMDGDHPVSWYKMFEGARTWVTLVGHDMSTFSDTNLLAHIRGGVLWAGSWDEPGTGTSVVNNHGNQETKGPCGLCLLRAKSMWSVYREGRGKARELRMDGKTTVEKYVK